MEKSFWNYQPKCLNGHELEWTNCQKQTCDKCGKPEILSRWSCAPCEQSYCTKCYKPPQSGNKCPLGHEMIEMKHQYFVCDCCMKSLSGKVYRDIICDFDLCKNCRISIIKED